MFCWTKASLDSNISHANNSRFLILPEGRFANVGSRVLGLLAQRIAVDWQTTFGHPLLLLARTQSARCGIPALAAGSVGAVWGEECSAGARLPSPGEGVTEHANQGEVTQCDSSAMPEAPACCFHHPLQVRLKSLSIRILWVCSAARPIGRAATSFLLLIITKDVHGTMNDCYYINLIWLDVIDNSV